MFDNIHPHQPSKSIISCVITRFEYQPFEDELPQYGDFFVSGYYNECGYSLGGVTTSYPE